MLCLKANRFAVAAFLWLCVGCGDSDGADMNAAGLEYVQKIEFDSTIQAEIVGDVDVLTMVADGATMVVHRSHSRSAYDFNVRGWLREEGAVVVFEHDGGRWQRMEIFTAITEEGGALLGNRMALAGDWLFASYGSEVWVFRRTNEAWSVYQVLEGTIEASKSWCTNSGMAATESMLVVISACEESRVFVFELSGGKWTQTQELPTLGALNPGGDVDCAKGPSVALTETTLVVGAPVRLGPDWDQTRGRVLVYERSGRDFGEPRMLTSETAGPGARFGCAVAAFGERVAVGAPLEAEEAGAVYLFSRIGGAWMAEARLQPTNRHPDQWFGFDVVLSDDRLLISAPRDRGELGGVNQFGRQSFETEARPGAAYLFFREGGDWEQRYYLKDHDPAPGEGLGGGVALSGRNVFVGQPSNDQGIHVWTLTE